MLQFLNDVRVTPLTAHGDFIKVSRSSAPRSGDSGDVSSEHEGIAVQVNNARHDDGVPFAAIPITAIVFTFIYLIVKAIMAPFSNRNRPAPIVQGGGLTQEEVAILHKLQRTLSQMESRVEALETILIDQSRTEKHYGSKL